MEKLLKEFQKLVVSYLNFTFKNIKLFFFPKLTFNHHKFTKWPGIECIYDNKYWDTINNGFKLHHEFVTILNTEWPPTKNCIIMNSTLHNIDKNIIKFEVYFKPYKV